MLTSLGIVEIDASINLKPFLNLCQYQCAACSSRAQEIHKILGCTAVCAVLNLKFILL
jgi:hypothetical protein